ncbi:putative carnitinyl-CoA dehydratase [Talaromyces proteolyticus]|uniref:Carnitinyl-CoA dehydratase n=1 Tax=Talaromyces proteolyticus TaxID=1131652 RepID=A0AAD4L0D6_9EURO|nr:putative carnitinyl-CoA dehydratase [Talaromyces proteolyticus]KAH8704744.1 putative carnitinyl-CoA dehydratase [Talaromyces proteolyticus]
MTDKLESKPPSSQYYLLSYPAPHVLLVTINREKHRNALNYDAHWDAEAIFRWFDKEPSLRVAVITGKGAKAFCAGQDLIEQRNRTSDEKPRQQGLAHPPGGFAGLSRRRGKKPVVAAVNGYALGGGFEICLNCDMVVASPTATFGLPEAQVGLYAAAGGLARITRIAGLQIASEVAMANRKLTAEEAQRYLLANKISKTPESVVDEAVELARKISNLSPDAIIVTRHGIREAWETPSVEGATIRTQQEYMEKLTEGENFGIGVHAFANKTKPKWVPSKL